MKIRFAINDGIMDEHGHAYTITDVRYPNYYAIDRSGNKFILPIQETDWSFRGFGDTPVFVVIDQSVHSIMKVFYHKNDAEEYQKVFGGLVEKHYVI